MIDLGLLPSVSGSHAAATGDKPVHVVGRGGQVSPGDDVFTGRKFISEDEISTEAFIFRAPSFE